MLLQSSGFSHLLSVFDSNSGVVAKMTFMHCVINMLQTETFVRLIVSLAVFARFVMERSLAAFVITRNKQ